MTPRHIRQRLDENLTSIQAFRSPDPISTCRFCLVDDLPVYFVKCLDVVGCECYGDQDEVLVALFHVFEDGVLGLGAKPGGGADLRLPAETVGVAEGEALHDGVDSGGDFGGVGITCLVGYC